MSIEQTLATAVEAHRAGHLAQAERLYGDVLRQQPDHPDALHLLGVVFSRSGRPLEAAELIQRAIRINPNAPDYWINLGTVLDTLRRPPEAIAAYEMAIALRPDSAEAHNNLANALAASNRLEDAVAEFQRALVMRPNYAEAWYNFGNIHHQLSRADQAVDCLTRATELAPTFAPALNNLGQILSELGRHDEAISAFQKALKLCPQEAGIHLNLGNAWHSRGEMDSAADCFEAVLKQFPKSTPALCSLANVMKDSGRIEMAVEYHNRALNLNPSDVAADDSRVYSLTMHPEYAGPEILRELRVWEQRHAQRFKASIREHPNYRAPDRPLRIGYVSADFRDHVVGRNVLPLLRDRDRQRFEAICYSNVAKSDALTARFKQLADGWRDIQAIDDAAAAELVRSEGIDILVDLSLHTADNRLLLFARKPAPVQVTFAGYPGSTGLTTIDWRLTDPYLDPSDGDYSEQSYRLPHSFWCYDPESMQWDPDSKETPPDVSSLPALQNGFITFGCLNNHAKVNEKVLHLWGRAMASVPNSHLLQTAPYGWPRRRVTQILSQYGVHEQRIHFVAYKPRRSYLADFSKIDIALDTFPYNGHTATLDALWMGVPVITRVGKTVVGRAGLSQLSNLGLTDLIAQTDDQFVAIARGVAGNLPRLTDLRNTLRSRMLASPLCNGKQFTTGIEEAFRAIWRQWCNLQVKHS